MRGLLAAALAFALCACGQKGPLYLPAPAQAQVHPAAAPAAAAPASTASTPARERP